MTWMIECLIKINFDFLKGIIPLTSPLKLFLFIQRKSAEINQYFIPVEI
jgi:hypothetical protein